jgi:hypothetical protein
VLPGDYNGDGRVSAADYTVWRNRLAGIGGTSLLNDLTPESVSLADYGVWKAHYGDDLGDGAGTNIAARNAVPEPGYLLLLIAAGMLSAMSRRTYRWRLDHAHHRSRRSQL